MPNDHIHVTYRRTPVSLSRQHPRLSRANPHVMPVNSLEAEDARDSKTEWFGSVIAPLVVASPDHAIMAMRLESNEAVTTWTATICAAWRLQTLHSTKHETRRFPATVIFRTEPEPDGFFNQNDVRFFSFLAGTLIIDSDTGNMYRGAFSFDAGRNIVGWDVAVAGGLSEIDTASDPIENQIFDAAILDLDSTGTSSQPGTWQVPEPPAALLWSLVGVTGLFVAVGRGRSPH